jgi:hypothetical protein
VRAGWGIVRLDDDVGDGGGLDLAAVAVKGGKVQWSSEGRGRAAFDCAG